MKSKERSSNFELLRIVAMMIIALHQNGMVNALAVLTPQDSNYQFAHIIESLSICSVNCFVLLSGYFMIKKEETPLKKCLSLLIDVAFWGLLGSGLAWIFLHESTSLKDIIVVCIPYIKGGRWFVRDYIILMLLSPFLNSCLRKLSKRNYQILLTILLLLFSLWPSFLPNPPIDDYGFSFVHFTVLYIVSGYLRLHFTKDRKQVTYLLIFIISVALIFASHLLGLGYAYAYNYLFVITAAVSLFLFFRGIKLQSSVINSLASGAFDVFVIHTTGFFANLIYIQLFHTDTALSGNNLTFLLTFILCPPAFYCFSIVLSKVKQIIFRNTVDKVIDALPIKNYSI